MLAIHQAFSLHATRPTLDGVADIVSPRDLVTDPATPEAQPTAINFVRGTLQIWLIWPDVRLIWPDEGAAILGQTGLVPAPIVIAIAWFADPPSRSSVIRSPRSLRLCGET
jgi:hypothetical protein